MKSATRISKVKSPKLRSAPSTVNGTVPPLRVENAKRRPREYLTVKEVGKLLDGARERRRYGHRDATMILVGYRHGLRVSELCALRWDQVDFERGMLHVRRVKNGTPSVHPLGGTSPHEKWRGLGDGYQVNTRITVFTQEDATVVPAGALFRKGDSWSVFVVVDGRAEARAITLLRRSGRLAAVSSGLAAGERVIVYPSDRIASGARVASR